MKTHHKIFCCMLFLMSVTVHAQQVIVNTTLIPPTNNLVTSFKNLSKINVLFTSNMTAFGVPPVSIRRSSIPRQALRPVCPPVSHRRN
jgi:hypothetical protein